MKVSNYAPIPISRASEVFVTGGLGFIGSHVADAYLAAGHRVTIIDSQVASVVDGTRYDNHPNCSVIRLSLEDFFARGGDFQKAARVIHAAGLVGPVRLLGYAGRVGPDIVRNASLVLEACLKSQVPVCVFSSAEVYGFSGKLAETDGLRIPVPYNSRIEYAVAKALSEAMTLNYVQHGLRGMVIRPFNVTGSRQSRAGGFVVPTLVQQALAGQAITVFGTGKQVRAFLSASDLAKFLTDYMDAAVQAQYGIYNVGNPGNSTTIENFAKRVQQLLGTESPLIYVDPVDIHGPMYREAESFEKVPVLGAAAALGWTPSVDLDALIMETAEYYRSNADLRSAIDMQGNNAARRSA